MSDTTYLYGYHSVRALLQQPGRVRSLLIQHGAAEKRLLDLVELATQQSAITTYHTRQELTARCGNEQHQGVIALCQQSRIYDEHDLPGLLPTASPPLLLVLDGVQDPHNLGACLRVANAAGVQAVIVPKNRAVSLTPTVRKVACGAAEITPLVAVSNLARCLRQLKELGIWLYATTETGTIPLYECSLTTPSAWVMGAEGDGLRRLTLEQCDFQVTIPMLGSVPSLNVSVATGICLYETVRQRKIELSGV